MSQRADLHTVKPTLDDFSVLKDTRTTITKTTRDSEEPPSPEPRKKRRRTVRNWKSELLLVEERDGAEILSINGKPFNQPARDSMRVKSEDRCQYRACCGSVEERAVRQIVEVVGMLSTEQIKFNRRQKIRATNLKKYGFENPFQSEEVKEKIRATNLKKYGFEFPSQSEEVKEKIKTTNLERRGCENPSQSEEVREKVKATNLIRYGYEIPMQNAEVFERQQKNSYRRKPYTFGDNTTEEVQGYEIQALKLLEEGYQYTSADFIQGKGRLQKNFPYCDSGKSRVYHPDIPTLEKGRLQEGWIEVKSIYTFRAGMEKNCEIIKKGKAVIDAGYYFRIWVFESDIDNEPVQITSANGPDEFANACTEYYHERFGLDLLPRL